MKPICRAPFSHSCEILHCAKFEIEIAKSDILHSAVELFSAFGNTYEVQLKVRHAGRKFEASKFGTRHPSSEGRVELLFCGFVVEVYVGIVASKPFYTLI